MRSRSNADLLSRQGISSQGPRAPRSALHDPYFHGVSLTLLEVLEASARQGTRNKEDLEVGVLLPMIGSSWGEIDTRITIR